MVDGNPPVPFEQTVQAAPLEEWDEEYARRACDSPVFLATVPPIIGNAPRGLGAALVPQLNSEIRLLAQAENVTLVDVWAAFPNNPQPYLGFDGLHPNADGYAKIADTFFTAIRTALELQQTTTTLASPQSGSTYSPARPRR